jgi:hypothetical protein
MFDEKNQSKKSRDTIPLSQRRAFSVHHLCKIIKLICFFSRNEISVLFVLKWFMTLFWLLFSAKWFEMEFRIFLFRRNGRILINGRSFHLVLYFPQPPQFPFFVSFPYDCTILTSLYRVYHRNLFPFFHILSPSQLRVKPHPQPHLSPLKKEIRQSVYVQYSSNISFVTRT